MLVWEHHLESLFFVLQIPIENMRWSLHSGRLKPQCVMSHRATSHHPIEDWDFPWYINHPAIGYPHLWKPPYIAGWWFGTFFVFPYIGNNHPNWLIFFRGVQTTNQMVIIYLLLAGTALPGNHEIRWNQYVLDRTKETNETSLVQWPRQAQNTLKALIGSLGVTRSSPGDGHLRRWPREFRDIIYVYMHAWCMHTNIHTYIYIYIYIYICIYTFQCINM